MRFLKCYLLGFCFLVAGVNSLRAQGLIFTLDSLFCNGNLSFNSAYIDSSTDDTLFIYSNLVNHAGTTVYLSNMTFQCSVNGVAINNLSSYPPVTGDTIAQGGSFDFTLILLNHGGSFPANLPTGSSVVIWPVYAHVTSDSIGFLLTYTQDSTLAGIGAPQNVYHNILYNAQTIHITFNNTDEKTIQLYDPIGRKVYEGENNSANADIDWGALPAAIYILRIRQGQQSISVKLVHF